MAQERKKLDELSKEELDRRIVFGSLDVIQANAERMTSGNFMHNKNAIKFMVDNVRSALNRLNIYEV